MFGKLTISG